MKDWTFGLNLPPLKRGTHPSPEDGLCAMEMVAFIERLPHSDSPDCTCSVTAAFVRGFNDLLNDSERQELVRYLPRLVGTVSKEHEQARAEIAAWRAIKVFAPIALQNSLPEHAKILREFEESKGLWAAAGAARAARAAEAAAGAARAAEAAAGAAWAAAGAAWAAEAAVGAAWAAEAAAEAARAAPGTRQQLISACFSLLNEMLSIGPRGRFTNDPSPEQIASSMAVAP